MTRTKKITCLDGVTRDCERLLSNDGWGYLDHRDGLGTVLVCIPDTNIDGNTQIPGNVPNASMSNTNLFGPLIYSYSRSDALADGALIDVSTMATEAGFTVHTALTLNVWCDCVTWDDEAEGHKRQGSGQDEAGRLWDVLQAARLAVMSTRSGNRATFQLRRVPRTGTSTRPQLVTLEVVIGPGGRRGARHHDHAAGGGLTRTVLSLRGLGWQRLAWHLRGPPWERKVAGQGETQSLSRRIPPREAKRKRVQCGHGSRQVAQHRV